jgi:hypothetical protein
MVDITPKHAPAPFIVGVGRSGTTLLRLMLDAHPELAIPAETHFLVDFLTPDHHGITRDRFFRRVTEAATWPNLALDTAAFRRALDELEPFSVSEAIRVLYRLYARLFGKRRWGDKTPPYRNHMVGIQQLLPEVHFVHIIRDGRDVALSYRGLWFGPGDDIGAQARFWVAQVLSARAQAAGLRHYLEIKFETLVCNPEPSLKTICSYLELPYYPRLLCYHKFASVRLAEFKRPFGPPGKTPCEIESFIGIHHNTKRPLDPGRIGRWRTEMSPEDRRRYESISGPLLRELGYDI